VDPKEHTQTASKSESESKSESVPATSETHAAPVSALMSSPVAEVLNEPAQISPNLPSLLSLPPDSIPQSDTLSVPPAHVMDSVQKYPLNSPDAETLHPSSGERSQVNLSTLTSGDPVALIQAAQSNVPFQQNSDPEEYDDRPRLKTSTRGRP
jgi:hypothetical protein